MNAYLKSCLTIAPVIAGALMTVSACNAIASLGLPMGAPELEHSLAMVVVGVFLFGAGLGYLFRDLHHLVAVKRSK